MALAICERIAEGETLSAICSKGSGMPSRQTFHRWVVRYPELSRAYAAARELSAHSLEEEALDMARELKDPQKGRKKLTPSEVRAFDIAMNQLRWSAARRNPRVYSERGAINVTVPIQINTSLDLGGPQQIENVYQLKAAVDVPQEPEQVDYERDMKADTAPLLTYREKKRQDNARARQGASPA